MSEVTASSLRPRGPTIGNAVIDKIRRDLRRYATAGKLTEPPGGGVSIDPFGVQVLYKRHGDHTIMFRGVTHDDIEWQAVVDFRAYSREYHDQVIKGVGDGIANERRTRRGAPIMLLDDIEPADIIH